MMRRILFAALLPACAAAQLIPPESAQSLMYFPHVADGGPAAQQWQTVLTFVNSNAAIANVTVYFFADTGGPLALNFGSGVSSQLTFAIPAMGSRIFRSSIASPTTITGWAFANANLPVVGTAAFRQIVNGKPEVEITANATLPSNGYYSAANSSLGVAVSNRLNSNAVSIKMDALDSEGRSMGQQTLTVPPLNHVSFSLGQRYPNLPANFTGTLRLTGATPADTFIAWTVGVDAGVLVSLPEGRTGWPISHYDRIKRVFDRLVLAGQTNVAGFGLQQVNLEVSFDSVLDSVAGGNTIKVYVALAELMGDSESELAFWIGHELGHVYQARVGRQAFDPFDYENDADVFAQLVVLSARYDPFAGLATLSRLAMATGETGFVGSFESQIPVDAHNAFNRRINSFLPNLQYLCTLFPADCGELHSLDHPHLPGGAPF